MAGTTTKDTGSYFGNIGQSISNLADKVKDVIRDITNKDKPKVVYNLDKGTATYNPGKSGGTSGGTSGGGGRTGGTTTFTRGGGGGGRRGTTTATTQAIDLTSQVQEVQAPTQAELLKVTRSGSVVQGRTTYIGNAIVGTTGKTANQIRLEAQREAQRQENLQAQQEGRKARQVGQGRFEATYSTVEKEVEEIPSTELKVDKQKVIDIPIELKNELNILNQRNVKVYDTGSEKQIATMGGKGTSILVPYTEEEQKKKEEWKESGVVKTIFGGKENILLQDVSSVSSQKKKETEITSSLNEVGNKISILSNKVNEVGEWTGTENELKTYNELVNKQNRLLERYKNLGGTTTELEGKTYIQPKTYKSGLFGLYTDVTAEQVYTDQSKPVNFLAKVSGQTLGSMGEALAGKTSYKIKESTILVPKTGTVSYNSLGQPEVYNKVVQPEGVGYVISPKVGNIIGTSVPYIVAPSLFFLGAGENIVSSMAKAEEKYPIYKTIGYQNLDLNKGIVTYKEETKKDLFRPFKVLGSGAVTYVKENPMEALALGTMGFFKAKSIVEEAKVNTYLNPIKGQYSLSPTSYSDDIIKETIKVPKVTTSTPSPITVEGVTQYSDEVSSLVLKPKVKGATTTTYSFPSQEYYGEGTEVIKNPSLFGRLTGRKTVEGYTTSFLDRGTNELTLATTYGDDILKVTKVGSKGGTVELFKIKGKELKLLESGKVSAGNLQAISEKTEEVLNKKTDINFNPKLNVRQEITPTTKTTTLTSLEEGQQGSIKLNNMFEPQSYKGTGETVVTKTTTTYPSTSVQQVNVGGFFDEITSGSFKTKGTVKVEGKSAIVKEMKSPVIEFGTPNNIDKTVRTFKPSDDKVIELIKQDISPTTVRDISQFSSSSFLVNYGDDITKMSTTPTISSSDKELLKSIKAKETSNKLQNIKDDLGNLFKTKNIKNTNIITTTTTTSSSSPTYVGGTQLYSQEALINAELAPRVYVEETSQFLKNIPVQTTPSTLGISPIGIKIETSGLGLNVLPAVSQLKVKTIQPEISIMTSSLVQEPQLQTKQKEYLKTINIIKPELRSSLKEKQLMNIEILEPQLQTKQRSKLKTQQQLKTQQITKLEQIQLLRSRQIERKVQQPEYKVSKIALPSFKTTLPTKEKRKAKDVLGDMFEVFQKTKGKDISIGTEEDLFKASKKLTTSLQKGLEASGYIVSKQTGKKVSFGELAPTLSPEFRAGKRDITRIVQRREKRLGTKSETYGIQRAKKIKSGWL